MFNLKMVDTAGGGIKKIFNFQRERYFPLPDYDLSDDRVKVSISGKILDMNYARLLAQNKDLTLDEIIMCNFRDKISSSIPKTVYNNLSAISASPTTTPPFRYIIRSPLL